MMMHRYRSLSFEGLFEICLCSSKPTMVEKFYEWNYLGIDGGE